MGNICRSPTAQGVFEHTLAGSALADKVDVDSAGTHAYHVGEPPYPKSQSAARKRGIDLSTQRARQVTEEDFEAFDLILAMDLNNFSS
ncbi:MAG: low molecular weight protein-tyrosine-phosphatase, partial [Pseudomonadota bacterium]